MQIYLSFVPSESHSAVSKLTHCLSDICDWIAANFLKLNDDKTERLLIGHPKRLAKVTAFELLLGDVKVRPSPCARTPVVYFDVPYHSKLLSKRLLSQQYITSVL